MTAVPAPARTGPRAHPALFVGAALVAALALLPVAYLVVRALEGGGPERAVDLLWRRSMLVLAVRSLGLAVLVATASTLLGGALAWITTLTDLPGRRLWTVLAVAPLAAPCYVGASAYIAGLSARGPIGRAWEAMGLGVPPAPSGFWAAAAFLTLFIYPYAYLPLRAGMRSLDRSVFEAARSLGRSPLRAFVSAALPALAPSAVVGWMLVALYTLSEFGAVALLRCDTFTRVIYIQYQSAFDRTGAAVTSLTLVAIAALLLFLAGRVTRPSEREADVREPGRRIHVHLHAWRWAALGLCAAVTLAAVVVPTLLLVWWLLRAPAGSSPLEGVLGSLATTVSVSSGAALLAVVVALPVALLAARAPVRLARFFERTTYLGFALPGIVVALGIAFFAVRTPLYQTWPVVALAYLVLFLPQAVGPEKAALQRAPLRLVEAARSLGRGPARAFATVTLPVASPGLVVGWLLVFITASRELPATLLLSPAGSRTLATSVWQATSEAIYSEAAAPALLLILLSSGAVALIVRRERLAS